MNKYRNVNTYIGATRFDSQKESQRFIELSILQKNGLIKNLERQKRFQIVPKSKGERAVFYVADFVYQEGDKLICEDVKSAITKKDSTYIIKRKLFKINYPEYEFREI